MTGKTILILGFTKRTSFSAAKILLEEGNRVLISDKVRDNEKIGLLSELKKFGRFDDLLGMQTPEILDKTKIDFLLPSPGVPMSIPVIQEARKKGILIIGDIELFYRHFPENIYIGITGTDGKTTTTTLVYEIIKKEREVFLGGNIGIPVFEHFHSIKKDSVLVLELSSFQLEEVKDFHPGAGAILNIAEDHLDRYDSLENYLAAKKNIFKNQEAPDFAVLNLDSPFFEQLKDGIKANILTFSLTSEKASIYYKNNSIYYNDKSYIDSKDIKLMGIHNVENAMAAILLSKSIGISDDNIKETLSTFKGLEHRLEFVREIKGVEFYNDSKSTTVNALEKALRSFEKPVILIAGGRDKGLDFTKIRELIHKKLKELILIGEASEKIKNELEFKPNYKASDFKDAVLHASNSARSGDIVLLSPACASFDMFKDYEERGRAFKDMVKSL